MRKIVLTLVFTAVAFPQNGNNNNLPTVPLASLKRVPVPAIPNLDRYVRDNALLTALGKAFFWDMQAGSDGRTACATCHFHAGADSRTRAQLTGSNAPLNHALSIADFPFRQLANPTNANSQVLRDNRFIAGSAGVLPRLFRRLVPGASLEDSTLPDPQPAVAHLRQITARNSPSVINAVFYVRNFWDGRARNIFTGATPFGESDVARNVWAYRDGALSAEPIRLENSSLASQAVGPALNEVEMSWAGRQWVQLARKLLALTPLGRQTVNHTDSVFAGLVHPDSGRFYPGVTYPTLIRAAFQPELWSAPDPAEGPTQLERNFPLFWGLALQAYQATLISDDSRVDRFFEGQPNALSALEQQGLREFQNGGSQCMQCHGGPELSAAAFSTVNRRAATPNNPSAAGFFRIGVSPIEEDPGLGANDGFNLPLFIPAVPGAANGTFKAPSLRNVELTGPYFHNGSQATLEQVLEFYERNGDIRAGGNLGPGIGQIRLGQGDRNAIVAFLKALTDDRVKFQRAPFDHPSLCLPNGQQNGEDQWILFPATGRQGSPTPLPTFEQILRNQAPAPQSCVP